MNTAQNNLEKLVVYKVKEFRVVAVGESVVQDSRVDTSQLSADFFRDVVSKSSWFDEEKECFIVLLLNRRNRVKSWNLVSLGGATASLAHPREVFRAACVASATAVICIHNHPSGDPAPSSADLAVTRQLRDASKTLGIELMDHVIVGRAEADPNGRGFYSFRDAGFV